MKTYVEWLDELIIDLNYDTLIEEPWSVTFLDKEHVLQSMGSSRQNKIYVNSLDRTSAEFPVIRTHLEGAKRILHVFRICRICVGSQPLPEEYKDVFRVDYVIENDVKQAVLLDINDVIVRRMHPKDVLDFMNTYQIPVPILEDGFPIGRIQHVMVDDSLVLTNSNNTKKDDSI